MAGKKNKNIAVEVETSKLKHALGRVGAVMAAKMPLPILSTVKLEAVDGHVSLSATNLDQYATEMIDAKVGSAGSVCASWSLLNNLCGRVSASKMKLELKDKLLFVTAGQVEASIETLPDEEFPPNLEMDGADEITCDTLELIEPIRATMHAMSRESDRYTLQGINLGGEKVIDFAATNGRQMAQYKSGLKGSVNAIVPAAAVRAILQNIDGEKATLKISTASIAVKSDGSEVRSKLIEGSYPNYRQIIPEESENVFTANREELIEAIQTVAIFRNSQTVHVSMSGTGGKEFAVVCDRARQIVIGAELADQPEHKVLFDPKYLLAALKAMTSEVVRLQSKDSQTPLLIRDGAFTAVVAPINQQQG